MDEGRDGWATSRGDGDGDSGGTASGLGSALLSALSAGDTLHGSRCGDCRAPLLLRQRGDGTASTVCVSCGRGSEDRGGGPSSRPDFASRLAEHSGLHARDGGEEDSEDDAASSESSRAVGSEAPADSVDATDAGNYIAVTLPRPMGIVFGEDDSEGGGIVVLEISGGSAAEADGSVRPGDRLVSAGGADVSGMPFEEALGRIVDSAEERTELVFLRGTAELRRGPAGAGRESPDGFLGGDGREARDDSDPGRGAAAPEARDGAVEADSEDLVGLVHLTSLEDGDLLDLTGPAAGGTDELLDLNQFEPEVVLAGHPAAATVSALSVRVEGQRGGSRGDGTELLDGPGGRGADVAVEVTLRQRCGRCGMDVGPEAPACPFCDLERRGDEGGGTGASWESGESPLLGSEIVLSSEEETGKGKRPKKEKKKSASHKKDEKITRGKGTAEKKKETKKSKKTKIEKGAEDKKTKEPPRVIVATRGSEGDTDDLPPRSRSEAIRGLIGKYLARNQLEDERRREEAAECGGARRPEAAEDKKDKKGKDMYDELVECRVSRETADKLRRACGELGRRGADKGEAAEEDAAERRGGSADGVASEDETGEAEGAAAGAGIPDGDRAGRGGGDPPVRGERCVANRDHGRDPPDAREPAGSAREAPSDGVGRAPPAGVERPRPVPDRHWGIRKDGIAPPKPPPRPEDGPDMDEDDVRSLLTEIQQRFSREGAEAAGLLSAPSFQSSASSLLSSAPSLAPSASSRLSDGRSRRSRGPACGRPSSGLATISERPPAERAPGRLWGTAEERRSRYKECLRAWRGGRVVGTGGGAGGMPCAVRAE